MEEIDKPTIASISGPAVGAGLDMALMCDMRLASRSARLCESYIRVGFVPGAGGCYYLPRIVGLAKAYELFITGDFVGADEALRIGLVNHVYDDERLLDETYDLARRLTHAPAVSAGILKRTLYQSSRTDLRTALDLVSSHMGVVRSTATSRSAFVAARSSITGRGDTD
jgi:enoyl-CoA hydratase/carnithine racemase